MSTVLKLENVTKKIGDKTLVDNISFEVNSGEIFGFLGPNGAGKTTTIKMITGLYSISSGEIFIDGKSVKKNFEKALENIGGIIENPEMYGYLTGLDNLKIFARMHGAVTKERIDEVIKLVKLENRINDKVSKYSLGMRQRLGIAQALLNKPKLLILDEPTNGLDPMGIKEMRETLRHLAETEGLSVLVSSHLLSEMELMCDRFGIVDNGKMIGIKTIGDIKSGEAESVNSYLVDVDNKEIALDVMKEKFTAIRIEENENGIKLECEREYIPKVNRSLVEKGIDVYGITLITHSLEEEFMNITEGSKGQIR